VKKEKEQESEPGLCQSGRGERLQVIFISFMCISVLYTLATKSTQPSFCGQTKTTTIKVE
jgi:hypothetical protein